MGTIIMFTFLSLFLLSFITSITCLILCIISKIKAEKNIKKNKNGLSPYEISDPYNNAPSAQSLEMQQRWLRHKAMIRDNRRDIDDRSESSKKSKRSKRSKSSGTKSKKSKLESSNKSRNDVILGNEQPQIIGTSNQQEPIRLYLRNQQPSSNVGFGTQNTQPIIVRTNTMQQQQQPVIVRSSSQPVRYTNY